MEFGAVMFPVVVVAVVVVFVVVELGIVVVAGIDVLVIVIVMVIVVVVGIVVVVVVVVVLVVIVLVLAVVIDVCCVAGGHVRGAHMHGEDSSVLNEHSCERCELLVSALENNALTRQFESKENCKLLMSFVIVSG